MEGGVESRPQTTGQPPPRADVQCLSPECLRARGHPVQVESRRTSECGSQLRAQVPGANRPYSLRETHASTAKNYKVQWSGLSSFFPHVFFFNLFLKKHTCAAVFVQRVRTQNKYVIGHSGRFTVIGS